MKLTIVPVIFGISLSMYENIYYKNFVYAYRNTTYTQLIRFKEIRINTGKRYNVQRDILQIILNKYHIDINKEKSIINSALVKNMRAMIRFFSSEKIRTYKLL